MTFTKHTLSNGMLVMLKEIHTTPIISHWVWYRVGSRDEPTGKTGLSHWVEHVQFRGTPTFPGGILDKEIARLGGYWNAMTSLDFTTYYETLPSTKIALALQLEADRMTNSLFTPEDVEAERTIIISERQGSENSPFFLLTEEIQAAAFRVHPYHHEVIGDMADLHTITRDDLYQHYQTYYAPNNAVLGIAGDFDTATMLGHIENAFGQLSTKPQIPRLQRPEPEQKGERRITLEGEGDTPIIELAYHAPSATHPDFMALSLASGLLCGVSSLSMFSSHLSNKTSRLYRALIDQEYAVSVYGGMSATIDPHLLSITALPHPDRTSAETLARLDEIIDELQNTPPTIDELERTRKQARALFAYSSESISNQAYWLGFSEIFANYNWFETYLDRLNAITPKAVQHAAQTYLRRQNRVVGEYRPVDR